MLTFFYIWFLMPRDNPVIEKLGYEMFVQYFWIPVFENNQFSRQFSLSFVWYVSLGSKKNKKSRTTRLMTIYQNIYFFIFHHILSG